MSTSCHSFIETSRVESSDVISGMDGAVAASELLGVTVRVDHQLYGTNTVHSLLRLRVSIGMEDVQ